VRWACGAGRLRRGEVVRSFVLPFVRSLVRSLSLVDGSVGLGKGKKGILVESLALLSVRTPAAARCDWGGEGRCDSKKIWVVTSLAWPFSFPSVLW